MEHKGIEDTHYVMLGTVGNKYVASLQRIDSKEVSMEFTGTGTLVREALKDLERNVGDNLAMCQVKYPNGMSFGTFFQHVD